VADIVYNAVHMEQVLQFLETLWSTGFGTALTVLGHLAPIWVPGILLLAFGTIWMKYIRASNIYNQGSALLEIRLPQEVSRSPRAMEMVITSMFQKGEPEHLLLTYWNGKIPPWFSLELVSVNGYIHFYIWTLKKFKGMIEQNLYAQYPNIEVIEVEDYTKPVRYDPTKYELFGAQFKKSKPDVYPIQTYVDYGLDKAPDEEVRDDPMTPMLEYLGSMQKGEQIWIQILIEAHKEEGLKYGRLIPKKDWKGQAQQEITKPERVSNLLAWTPIQR